MSESSAAMIARDNAARAEALDTRRSFIVQAPAGSGKTALLTQRVLALLAEVEAPEQIVAMTFTRKAAAEMRQRILGELQDPRRPEECTAEHEAHTRRLAQAARARDAAMGWQLSHASNRLRITTIDGFCGGLVRRAPWLSGAGGMPSLVDDARPHHRVAARRTIAQRDRNDALGEALRRLLDHVDGHAERLTAMLAALIARRDAWRGLLSGDRQAMREVLESHLHALCTDTMARAHAALSSEQRARWWASAQVAAQHLPEDGALQAAVALGHLPQDAGECGHWPALCSVLLTKEGALRKSVDKRIGFPTSVRAAKAEHEALLQELAAGADAEPALRSLAALVAPRYQDAQWRTLEDLLAVFRHALAELSLCFSEQGAADHTEIALRALDALGDPAAPSPLLLRLDHRIQHLLVDEFQDTSDVQMRLLERLTAGWETGDGRSLFLVGDPMQSIYRFRNANVGLFLQARRRGIGHLSLTPLTLTRNFRSQQGIVDWVNTTFSQVFGEEDAQRGAVAFAPAAATHPQLPGEAVHWYSGDELEEAERIAALCAATPAGESVAILVRGRSHLRHILPALQSAGIAAQAVDIDPLGERPVVQDLIALTRAINTPGDRIAWLAVLRAPWCGLPLPELQDLCEGLPNGAALWPALDRAAQQGRLSAHAQARLARVLPVLRKTMQRRGRDSLATLVEYAWRQLGGPACVRDPTALTHAAAMLDALAEASEGAPAIDAVTLDQALDGLFANASALGGTHVQIMTMHKAKGLQFDHVILPGLHRAARSSERPALVQSSVLLGEHEAPLLAPIPHRESEDDALYRLLHQRIEGARDRAEAERLLYVAATRAIRSLHCFADLPSKADGGVKIGNGLLSHLWPAVGDEVLRQRDASRDEPLSDGRSDEALPARSPSLQRLPLDWTPPPSPEALPAATAPAVTPETIPPFDWAGERARVTGTLYHLCVERIACDGLDRWDRERWEAQRPWLMARARAAGLDATDAEATVAQVFTAVDNTLADSHGRWLLQDHAGGHACELAMDSMTDGIFRRLRIDRTFIDDQGERWIVDYKTGTHGGGDLDAFIANEIERYRGQLERYAALFADEGRPLRLALYLPLLPQGQRLVRITP